MGYSWGPEYPGRMTNLLIGLRSETYRIVMAAWAHEWLVWPVCGAAGFLNIERKRDYIFRRRFHGFCILDIHCFFTRVKYQSRLNRKIVFSISTRICYIQWVKKWFAYYWVWINFVAFNSILIRLFCTFYFNIDNSSYTVDGKSFCILSCLFAPFIFQLIKSKYIKFCIIY